MGMLKDIARTILVVQPTTTAEKLPDTVVQFPTVTPKPPEVTPEPPEVTPEPPVVSEPWSMEYKKHPRGFIESGVARRGNEVMDIIFERDGRGELQKVVAKPRKK